MLRRRILRCLALIVLLFAHGAGSLPSAAAPGGTAAPSGVEIEPGLQQALERNPDSGYLIYFEARPDLDPAYTMDWEARGRFVVDALRATAERSQAPVRAYLEAQGARFTAFWIDNVIAVESSGAATLQGLSGFHEVAVVRARRTPVLYEPEVTTAFAARTAMAIEPNIARVGADAAWEFGYTGEGLVVAHIDTGVRFTHHALRAQYRGNLGSSYDHNHNWWDPYGTYPSAPGDPHGHGTHVMGTIVGNDGGANRIGVAPAARWIACRGFAGTNPDTALLECAQWVAAPWDLSGNNANPDLRPHVVNNSWGDCRQHYDGWYQGVVNTWQALGIYPVFANGNRGNCDYTSPPPCGTVGNPARYANVTGVGSTGQSNGAYAYHSNRGPTDAPDPLNPNGYPTLKPQVAAPGVSIRSSATASDSSYSYSTGTSMSAPHVAGLVALAWQAGPCLVGDYVATRNLIEQAATPVTTGLPESGCADEGPHQLPNQSTGWGEISALAAVEAAADHCLTRHMLSGVVRDALTGWPLYTEIRVAGDGSPEAEVTPSTEYDVAWTNPVTGAYSLTLAHTTPLPLTFTSWVEGYEAQTITLPPLTATTTLDVDLVADLVACTAPGYSQRSTILLAESFDTDPTALPGGWAQVAVSGADSAWATSATTRHPSGFPPRSGPGLVYFNSYSTGLGSASRLYRTAGLDLSTASTTRLSLWLFEDDEYPGANDRVQVQASTDGGTTWANIGAPLPRYNPSRMWREHQIDLSAYTGPGMNGVQIGFLGISEYGNDLHIDDVVVSSTTCVPATGGLVVGHARDANTLAPLPGASVENERGDTTTSGMTLDPAVEDGFYTLFMPAGTSILTATLAGYGPGVAGVTIGAGETVARDLLLSAGFPIVSPPKLHAIVELGAGTTLDLSLRNHGDEPFSYSVLPREREGPSTVAWLAADPAIGSLAPGTQQRIEVTFDSNNVSQPGHYLADLQFVSDTPYAILSVPVTMTVQPAPGSALLAGTVTGLGLCDRDPLPLAGATVTIESSQSTWTLLTGPVGDYQFWLDAAESPLTITATAAEHLSVQRTSVGLTAGLITTINLDLRLDAPCISVQPKAIQVSLAPEEVITLPITVANTGAAGFDYLLEEADGGFEPGQNLLRQTGSTAVTSEGVPWLSAHPSSGTLAPDGAQIISITLDAHIARNPGHYAATLHLTGGDPVTSVVSIPVTLTVGPQLTLSVHISGGGRVMVEPDKTVFATGEVVTLTAQANAGWRFHNWRLHDEMGERGSTANPLVHEMRSNTAVVVTFVPENTAPFQVHLPLLVR